ncbi:MAG: hypothetical protein NT080_03545 [Spirochaetes bacterium]|nr:hypothetical protein [Spirochaetota bacterium]
MIKADGRATRIWQRGSLLDRARFSEISDIDVAVEGIAGAADYFDLLGRLMDLTMFPLDFLELEKVGKSNAWHIREQGRLVHGRSS